MAVSRAEGTKETVTTATTVAPGDNLTVSNDGFASIQWFDDSVSRLKAGTIIRITATDYNPDDISQTKVNFEVVTGTVWSKVMDLVNGESSFSAQGGGVVSVVRGTVFNMTITTDAVLVDAIEHATFVKMEGEETRDIAQGESA